MKSSEKPSGMFGFTVVWIGQIVSVLASSMSGFALSIWMFQQTHSATAMSAMYVSFLLPFMLITPFAGAMVDRHNRKLMMMVSDLTAVLATVAILILQAVGHLQFWHLYIANLLYGLGNAFQWPAYSAAISTMVPKEQYGRANGMMSLIDSGPAVFSPIMAGALLPFLGLTGILFIDVVTFFLAIGALLIVHVPQPKKTVEGQAGKGNIWKETAFGFKYIFDRPSLRAYLIACLVANLSMGLSSSLAAPMILSRTNQNSVIFGAVQTAGAIGGVLGGLFMTAWGGSKRRIPTALTCWIIRGLLGFIVFGISRSPLLWIATTLMASMVIPIADGSSQAMWQAKVASDVQGRVFSARRFIAWLLDPLSPMIAGLLADFVTEPAMHTDTAFAEAASWLVGSGPGSGMSLQYVLAGVLYISVPIVALLMPVIRNMEDILPDHDQMEMIHCE